MIEITGYVTKSHVGSSFTLKITSDNVEDEKGNHPEVSKETEILIARNLYPNDVHTRFEKVQGTYQTENLETCCSISRELKKGDRVKCSVFIVDTRSDNGAINTNPNDIETYTKFELWLYPDPTRFERLEVDTPETLKFRKQNYYTDINKKKCEKITGHSWYYSGKWWINKNPKITFPILWWVKVRTTASNLWRRLTKQENLARTLIITNIISIIGNIILAWLLFFKKP